MTIPLNKPPSILRFAVLALSLALNVNGERTNNVCFLLQPKCFFD